MTSLTDSLRGLGINAKGGNVTTTQQQEALQSPFNTANQVSKDSGLGGNTPSSTRRHAKRNILNESSRDNILKTVKDVEGHYVNQEHKEEIPFKPVRRLRLHCTSAQLMRKSIVLRQACARGTWNVSNLGKKIRVSNASSGVTGLFDSLPQSEKSV